MAEIYYNGEPQHPPSPSSNLPTLIKFAVDENDGESKRQKMNLNTRESGNVDGNSDVVSDKKNNISSSGDDDKKRQQQLLAKSVGFIRRVPKYGVAAVCGRRRAMEDAVAIHPSLVNPELHYFAVYDGHGCSHVAMMCKERLHELMKEEVLFIVNDPVIGWRALMEKSFAKMDEEAFACLREGVIGNCRCELRSPECDAVGSTAVVAIVTPDKIIVANCGDSRAVLSTNGRAIPLSSDHKPDRPDELRRIEEAGGRVIYWQGPRVLGMLNMSRAIGDNYLKPYVTCEPEVTITERTIHDECLILATDGLWDVVSNDTACGVARMCLHGKELPPQAEAFLPRLEMVGLQGIRTVDKKCKEASALLTKLALARNSGDNVSVVVIDLNRRRRRTNAAI